MKQQEIFVFDSKRAMAESAVAAIIAAAQDAVAQRGECHIALSGGGTPQPVYELLAKETFARQMPWSATHFFWGDERLVPPTEDGSNFKQFKKTVLDVVDVPATNVHRVLGEASKETAVIHYTRTLSFHVERFDLVLLGMGSDGHTASLFPNSKIDPDNPVVAVTADYDGRPANRITLTPMILNTARQALFLVMGEKKAEMVAAVIQGETDLEHLPAQRIYPERGELIWYLDESAAAKLVFEE